MAAQSIEQNQRPRYTGTEFEFDFSCVCSVLLRQAKASFWTPRLRIAHTIYHTKSTIPQREGRGSSPSCAV